MINNPNIFCLTSLSNKPVDLAKEVGPAGIKKFLNLACKAYHKLYSSGKVNTSMNEDEITEELFLYLQDEWKKVDMSFAPIPQKTHHKTKKSPGKAPTIDICFRKELDSESYFGFECKILRENDTRLCKEYVDNGLSRYLSGKYSAKCSSGSMIGYVTFGDVKNVIKEIKKKVDTKDINKKMSKSYPLDGFDDHHLSAHNRKAGFTSPFNAHHLFFTFT